MDEERKKEAKWLSDKITLDNAKGLPVKDGKYCYIDDKGISFYRVSRESADRWVDEKNKSLGFLSDKESLEKIRESYYLIKEILEKYMDMKEEYYPIVSLWVIGTYFHNDFSSYPYLFFNATKGSGKSRIIELLSELSQNGLFTKSPTEAVLFRTKGMLGIDEFERVNNQQKAGVREILNSSYKKGVKIMRMKKVKSVDGENQVVEEFESYRPIAIANIWGMEEVLGDRCITLVLEKSNDPVKTRLIQDFNQNNVVVKVKDLLNQCSFFVEPKKLKYPNLGTSSPVLPKCSLCSVVSKNNIQTAWNNYIFHRNDTTSTTYYTKTTQTTQTTLHQDKFFNNIYDSNIKGRNLELFFPLLFLANLVDYKVFDSVLETAKTITEDKEHDDIIESKDIAIIDFISNMDESNNFYSVKLLLEDFKKFIDEYDDWMNHRWFGRALKRLNLIKDKRRNAAGVQIIPNISKAKEKIKIFRK